MEIRLPDLPEKYTKSDVKLLEYIGNHTEAFLFMSISQFAKETGMSEATISRFVKHMGYQDYKDMRCKMIQHQPEGGAVHKLAGTLSKNKSFDIQRWFLFQQECLKRTAENIDNKAFRQIIEAVKNAERIYIHAKNASSAAAQLLFFRLRRLGFNVSLIPSGGSEMIEGIAHAQKGDVAILFSFSKLSKEGRYILEYSKQAGFSTVAFTSRRIIPKEEGADYSIHVYRGEDREYHSISAAIVMVDALILALSEEIKTVATERLWKVQELKRRY